MGTTAEKLQKILDSKAAIKAAIEGKGVSDVGDVLSAYAGKIEAIKTGSDIKNQDKVVEITQNGQEVVTADEGYTGLGKVTVNTNVSAVGGGVQGQLYLKEGVRDSFESRYEIKSVVLPDNMDNVTNLGACFEEFIALTSVSLPELPNVASIAMCFSDCRKLESISLPEMPKLTNINSAFYNCSILKSITLPALTLVTNMFNVFYNCSSLTSISLSGLSNVERIASAFYRCYTLTSLSLPEITRVISLRGCFANCYKLESLLLPEMSLCTDLSECFKECSSLTYVPLPSQLPSVSSMSACFSSCWSLLSVSLPYMPDIKNMSSVFVGCSSLTTIACTQSLSKVTTMQSCFSGCTSLEEIILLTSSLPDINLANWGISTCTALTKNSLLNILKALPQTTNSRTCTLGETNLSKLSADDKAIATGKGWTLN